MNKIKVIDLLNMISKGEEVPKKIRITDIDDRITRHYNFFYDEDDQEYKDDELLPLGARLILDRVLNKRVEILEEEKKIPEKLEEFDIQGLEVSGYSMSQAEYLLEDGVEENREMINWILDYLKSKGE
jgi:hypothetical protein